MMHMSGFMVGETPRQGLPQDQMAKDVIVLRR